MEKSGTKSRLRPRRIIERPRLTRLLDGSTARVRMLIAPAGYGKTTLAEQWTSAPGRTAVWYQCRRASADVAHLAIGLAEAASALLPGCDTRLRERLLATKDPAAEVATLAAILREDLQPWPDSAWLVIDDYHFLVGSSEAEQLIEEVVRDSPLNVLITTRERPGWWSTRLAVYGALFELDQADLTMNPDEADLVLIGSELTEAVLELTHGWPAVISLVSGLEPAVAERSAPRKLYDFFANEILKDLDPDAQVALGRLAIAPVLDSPLARRLLGKRADRLVSEVLATGLVTEREGVFHLHPLARAFLRGHLATDVVNTGTAVDACLEYYVSRRDWDAAFELLDENSEVPGRDELLLAALDELLRAARLSTIEKWLTGRSSDSPISDIARGEVALRRAEYVSAQALAERALSATAGDAALEFKALRLAGRAAHSANRESIALEFFRRAERVASDDGQRREAQSSQLMCATALESDEAKTLLETLTATVSGHSPSDLVRLAGRRLMFDFSFGAIESFEDARGAEQLLVHVEDPLLRCSFRSPYATALLLDANYPEALRVASDLLADAAACHIELALPYGHIARALALAGLREFEEAELVLVQAGKQAAAYGDKYGEQSAYASRVRVLAQQGRASEACAIEPPRLVGALPNMHGEVVASRGLALACVGRVAEAEESAAFAASVTRGIEANTLVQAIRSIAAAESGGPETPRLAERLVDVAFGTRAIDVLVTAYRSSAALLRLLLSVPATRERALFTIRRAKDEEWVANSGHNLDGLTSPGRSLTPREREICKLASNALSNKEIAELLFISEGTVKTHLHNIFEKLGVKSRLALARAANQPGYAAPTATVDDAASGEGS